MLETVRDFMVLTEADFDRLPEDGLFEVVDGRAVLLPANDYEHQKLSDELLFSFKRQLKEAGSGDVASAVNVFIPRPPGSTGQVQNRIPDLVVFRQPPIRRFVPGSPPELVIEILASRRGNVERTEKLDDYAVAGIDEYWIVNPFDRAVEVYLLRGGEYVLDRTVSAGDLSPRAFPGVRISAGDLWKL